LWVVDDATGHGGNENDGSWLASGDHVLAQSLGHQERSSQVDVNQTHPHLAVVGLGGDVGARARVSKRLSHTTGNGLGVDILSNTSGVDQNVGNTVLLDDGVDRLVNGVLITNIHLEEGDGDSIAGELVKGSHGILSVLLVRVENDEGLGSSLSARLCHGVSETTGSTK